MVFLTQLHSTTYTTNLIINIMSRDTFTNHVLKTSKDKLWKNRIHGRAVEHCAGVPDEVAGECGHNKTLITLLIRPANSWLLSPPATRCMWRRSPLSWRRTVGRCPSWPASHTACHCRATSATWRRTSPRRSWSRMESETDRRDEINPPSAWRGKR